MAFYQKGIFDKTLADYNKAIELDPKYAVAYNNRGMLHYYARAFDKAFVDFDKAVELNQQIFVAYNFRGLLYFQKKDYKKAIADYNKAIELNSNTWWLTTIGDTPICMKIIWKKPYLTIIRQ